MVSFSMSSPVISQSIHTRFSLERVSGMVEGRVGGSDVAGAGAGAEVVVWMEVEEEEVR